MFILRRLDGEGHSNFVLGDEYEYVSRFEHYEKFQKIYENMFSEPHVADLDTKSTKTSKECYGFIRAGGCDYVLWTNQKNYIMTGDGSTFANVSH